MRHPYFYGHFDGSKHVMPLQPLDQFGLAVAAALHDVRDAADDLDEPWALIGGQALQAYGVPRDTLDVDVLSELAGEVALQLVQEYNWTPLLADEYGEYRPTDAVRPHVMDDKVLFDIHEQRVMFPLQSPAGIAVDLLTAQHPVEREMIELAHVETFRGEKVYLAPLGGILLVKTKADREKDTGAVYQAAEHLPSGMLHAAVEWAQARDPATAEDLASTITAAKSRLVPKEIRPPLTPRGHYPRKKR
jgi:hypothetical protein